jgi:restriction system protein
VKRIDGAQADFELAKESRTTLVACKRWKATRTGIEPLRELEAARGKREAHDCVYVATGEVTETAKAFSAEKNIRLVDGTELARMLAG